MIKRLIFSTLFALSAAAPALAQERAVAHESLHDVSVGRTDLDLAETRDVEVLLARLGRAASRVCEQPEVAHQGATLRRAIAACREETVAFAVERLGDERVSRVYAARED